MATHYFKKGIYQTPKGHEEDVKHMKDWLKGQPHLPSVSDEHLYLFMNSCDYQLTKSKETLENYFTLRTHTPEMFTKRDASLTEIQGVLNICNLNILDWTSPEGYKVALGRLVDSDSSKFNFVPLLKMFFMFIDMNVAEDGLRPGYIVVFDMKGISLSHLTKLNLSALKKFMTYVQECQPTALKAIHVINTVSFIDKLMALLKPLMKSDLLSMLKFHGPVEELGKFIPIEALPEEYGGKTESTVSAHAKTRAKMIEYKKWFQEQETLVVDETKRVGKKHPYAEIFGGAEGSFRKLELD